MATAAGTLDVESVIDRLTQNKQNKQPVTEEEVKLICQRARYAAPPTPRRPRV